MFEYTSPRYSVDKIVAATATQGTALPIVLCVRHYISHFSY